MEPTSSRQAKSLALFHELVAKLGLTGLGRRMRKPPLAPSTLFGWKEGVPWYQHDRLEGVARELAREEKESRGARRKKAA